MRARPTTVRPRAAAALLAIVTPAAPAPLPAPVPAPALAAAARSGPGSTAAPRTIRIVEAAPLRWDRNAPLESDHGMVVRFAGQAVERTVELPAFHPPSSTPRITARVDVQPVLTRDGGGIRPNDPWTRLGSVTMLVTAPGAGPATRATEVEVIRFITGYGAAGTFVQDVTALAPLLTGTRTFRVFISTFSERPGWEVSFALSYDETGTGHRRPVLAEPAFFDRHVVPDAADEPARLSATVTIPPGLARPRLRLLCTGHASDGAGPNEFVSSPHVLRIDGVEVARWRPWSELGATLRHLNPFAGRTNVGGQEVWASDHDRTGWSPGLVVEPLVIPVPELGPGKHSIELLISGIRPAVGSGSSPHGYWVESAIVVADEPLSAGPGP
jgi:hypothetical protein